MHFHLEINEFGDVVLVAIGFGVFDPEALWGGHDETFFQKKGCHTTRHR